MRQHHRLEVVLQRGLGQQRGIKAPPDQRPGRRIVLQQLVIQRQALLLQHRQRGAAQQCSKPAVKSAYLHRAAGIQNALV